MLFTGRKCLRLLYGAPFSEVVLHVGSYKGGGRLGSMARSDRDISGRAWLVVLSSPLEMVSLKLSPITDPAGEIVIVYSGLSTDVRPGCISESYCCPIMDEAPLLICVSIESESFRWCCWWKELLDDSIEITRLCRHSTDARLIASTTSGLSGPTGDDVVYAGATSGVCRPSSIS